jgi:hypothetical protein
MDIATISQLVGSLGFPIVCCYFMYKYINTTMKDFTNTMSENTKMLTKLYERLDVLIKKDGDENEQDS